MKRFSARIRVTGFLTLLCILLLSSTAMAAQTADQSTASIQSGSIETDNLMRKNSTGTVATASNATMSEEVGPGIEKVQPEETEPVNESPVYGQGQSLGFFTATAYCPSSSGKQQKTYSGTIPRPQHTLSADLSVLPLGSKVMIDGIIYTVEDTGSGIKGNKVDIYFGSRQEALIFGRQTKEIFAVIEQ